MIIILIIAIITLGLIITFIRYFFGETEGLVRQQLAQVKQTLTKDLEDGRELLSTSFGKKLEMKRGETKTIAFGVKNSFRNPDGEKVCYLLGVRCIKPFEPTGFCNDAQNLNDLYVGGVDLTDPSSNTFVPSDKRWVTRVEQGGKIDIHNNKVLVGEIDFQVPASADSYATEIVVWKEKGNRDCSRAQEFSPWQTYSFTTVVS